MKTKYLFGGRYHSKKFSNEDWDCSVIAVKYAYNLTYDDAHELLKANGRKDGGGFGLHWFLDKYDIEGRQTVKISFWKQYGEAKGLLWFARRYSTGTYILNFKNHVACFKDGILYDTVETLKKELRIYSAYKLLDK